MKQLSEYDLQDDRELRNPHDNSEKRAENRRLSTDLTMIFDGERSNEAFAAALA